MRLDLSAGCFQPVDCILPITDSANNIKVSFLHFYCIFMKLMVIVHSCYRKGFRLLENWLLECESQEDN